MFADFGKKIRFPLRKFIKYWKNVEESFKRNYKFLMQNACEVENKVAKLNV